MKPLDHRRSIDAYKFNHTANVIKKIVQQGSILEQLMNFAGSVPDFRRGDKGNIRHSWLFLLYQMWIILFIKHS